MVILVLIALGALFLWIFLPGEEDDYKFYKQWDTVHGTNITPSDLERKYGGR